MFLITVLVFVLPNLSKFDINFKVDSVKLQFKLLIHFSWRILYFCSSSLSLSQDIQLWLILTLTVPINFKLTLIHSLRPRSSDHLPTRC